MTRASKVVSLEEAAALIPNGANVAVTGFVTCSIPDYLLKGVEKAFLDTGAPNDLGLIYTAGIGDREGGGADRFAHEGMLRKVVAGHYAFAPALQALICANKVQGYNLPQGTLCEILRDTAGGRPGTVTKIGLGTFADPRNQGGRMNDVTTEDVVEVIKMLDEDWLFYHRQPVDVALVKASYGDELGNLTVQHEANVSSITAMATAAKNNGGLVIAQVNEVVAANTLDARLVKVPGFMVDAIVVVPTDEQRQTAVDHYQPAYSGDIRVPLQRIACMPLNERKVIARRAYLELGDGGGILNLGIGIPEGVALVAVEEGTVDSLKLTVESGISGGVPESGLRFGAGWNADMIIDEASQFDFYDGGGLDGTFIGLAQMDQQGNINVSRFGPTIPGCGGSINITQTAKKVVFCGTFTARGLKVGVADGQLKVLQEGSAKKLIEQVEQVTFSGDYARETGQTVLYITERAVFEMRPEGLTLTEIAPGVDLETDVLAQMGFTPRIADDLKTMDARIFHEAPMTLA